MVALLWDFRSKKILGAPKDIAMSCFLQLERKLARNPELHKQYSKFMDECKKLGHMSEINVKGIPNLHDFLSYSVLKPESTTTKVRVVFDSSAKSSSGYSLNEILAVWPTIQPELFTILVPFRLPCFDFTADIEKIYRQVMMSGKDKRFQLILWRDELSEYEMLSIEYGHVWYFRCTILGHQMLTTVVVTNSA